MRASSSGESGAVAFTDSTLPAGATGAAPSGNGPFDLFRPAPAYATIFAMILHDAVSRDTWRQAAACRGYPAEMFYPETAAEVAAAKRVCAGCKVRERCLELALRNKEQYGVWGGMTERERARAIRRSLRAA
jgi:WhiB family transcriptional regulator, redox-sensing transcriptional regulator